MEQDIYESLNIPKATLTKIQGKPFREALGEIPVGIQLLKLKSDLTKDYPGDKEIQDTHINEKVRIEYLKILEHN